MPESTCLHIQDRESGPIRVVELPWISVRIGRAAFCEVRLADQELAAEACRLTRRGRTWCLTPIGSPSPVLLDGRTVKSPCPLPFGVPFQIGSYCLTLRQDLGAEPNWEMYPASAPARLSAPVAPPLRELEERAEPEPEPARAATETTPGPNPAEAASRTGRDRTRWEARWKAAEAHLKSRSQGFQGVGEGQRGPNPSMFDAMPTRERPVAVARPAGGSAPLNHPVAPPIPTARAPRIEPNWSTPRSDPPALAPRVDPSVRPVPSSAARFEPAWTGPPAPPVAPAPTWTEWSARERPADAARSPAARRESAEPSDPVENRPDLDLLEESPAPIVGGWADEPVAMVAADREHVWPESIDHSQASTVDATESAGDEEERLVPPEVVAARDPADCDEPPPIAERIEAKFEPEGPRQVDDRRADAGKEDESEPSRDDRVRTGRAVAPSWEQLDDSSRPHAREPKKRRVGRDRVGPERRSKAPRGIRPGDRVLGSDSSRDVAIPTAEDVVWPSVKDILPNHGASLGPQPAVLRTRKGQQPLPTVPREPGQWMLPVWLAWPPVAVSVLVLGFGASVLSWIWAADSSSAAIVTHRLMRTDGSSRRKPLPDWVVPPDGRWLTTTSQHMAHWAVFLSDAEGDGQGPVPDVSGMLTRSLQISPLNPTARLAMARQEPSAGREARSVNSLGLSRDAVSLAWSARRLLDAGKKEAALRLYGQALSAASGGGFSRTAAPRYDDDETSRRYMLPGEDAVRDIVTEMAARDWTFREWSRALPQNPTVLLATARLLREQGRDEAEPLLALIIDGGAPASTANAVDPRALAARAEALALAVGSHLKEAEQEYRQAIELADNDMIRRSWWFNLADIALRLNDEPQRRAAIRAALDVDASDDITRRASSIQRVSDSRSRGRSGSAKAN